MKKSTTKEINANYLANLFEEKANEILEKEKATAKRKAKKTTVEKAEITEKAEKPKTVKKATKTVKKTADKVENSEKSQSTEKPKKVVKKAPKAVEKTADKEPKKTTKKKAEEIEQASEKEQELRKLDSMKVAKVTYEKIDSINSYDELSKAIENGDDVYVAFDISSVKPSEYENIFHVPFSKDMKDNFDICQPIFICEKNPRLVFASLYTEALWDLFPDEFELLSAVLIEKQPTKKTKK